ncbi:response regulator [Flavisolibacter ginsengisoli]|jgi:CheY-like chemotaxis protein|uniref:Response regulator receiver domain-containing protein n=1 Tax=Flavisolibacter ginsengisoli DSM 18119 TaxID=1121884 RepID=A0A1M5GCU9_9BACT|nr:response regulator [Flavisolibacter ginsengisoli]SHG01508.1 Response regulator receiver domain-containing protein [Flavisolibacter ginsengisoli DSM 18119]
MTQTNTRKHVVLYADDDPDDLMLVKEAFDRYADNVEVVTTTDGEQALFYLAGLDHFEPAPCLIILDINMPRLDGKEALKKIRSLPRFTDIPVVLFTTSSYTLDREFARQHKAGFITKPLDVRQIESIADQFVQHCTDEIKKNIRKKQSQ